MKTPTSPRPFPGSTNQHEAAPAGELRQLARGRFKVQVVEAATGRIIEDRPWQSNLILDSGLDRIATESWISQLAYCAAGTGNTPTKDLPDPGDEFSQSGTTVTRTTGTRDFSASDVGKLIRWASGSEAKITAYTNATTVTVTPSQTVAAGAIDALYRIGQTGLATETKRTSTQPQFIDEDDGLTAAATTIDAAAGSITFKVTRDFTEEVGSVNYTEIGMSSQSGSGNNLFSRMLLAGAVTVGAGQLLRVKYELTVTTLGAVTGTQTTVDGGITGWPLPYDIASITSNGTYWEITTTEAHHFLTGGKLTISGAKRPRTNITAATSNSSDFTLTAAGHDRSPGDSIVVEGMTPSGYNGTWTIASVSGDDITVTSVLNPGTGTAFGNLRQAEPGTWYDAADLTIASVPTTTTIRITNATSIAAAGADGTVFNNTRRKFVAVGYGVKTPTPGGYGAPVAAFALACGGAGKDSSGASANYLGLFDGSSSASDDGWCIIPASHPTTLPNDFPQYWGLTTASQYNAANEAGTNQSPAPTNIFTTGATDTADPASYTNGNFYRDWIFEFGAGSANYTDIKMIGVGINTSPFISSVQGYFLFEQPQRKKNTHKLTLTVRKSWGRDLSIIPN